MHWNLSHSTCKFINDILVNTYSEQGNPSRFKLNFLVVYPFWKMKTIIPMGSLRFKPSNTFRRNRNILQYYYVISSLSGMLQIFGLTWNVINWYGLNLIIQTLMTPTGSEQWKMTTGIYIKYVLKDSYQTW